MESYNMNDRELTIEQRMSFTLRKEKGLTLSRKMGGGAISPTLFLNICQGKMANPKGLKFLEFSNLSIDKRTDKKLFIFWGVPNFWPLKGDAAKKWSNVTAYNHHSLM